MPTIDTRTPFWRDHARRRYADIRQAQADKLLPVQKMLAERRFEKLEGSLISAEQIHNPSADSPIYLAKRLNYVLLLDQLQCGHLMEIGFNWGYSASLLLEVAASSRLHSIDIGWHWYTPPAGALMAQIYPGRFSYTWKDSREALLDQIAAGNRYDMISIDGGHAYGTARTDILLSLELLNDGGLLIVDDTDAPSVAGAVLATVADHPQFVELTPENFSLFEFGTSDIPCFEQRYFLKRMPLSGRGFTPETQTPSAAPATPPPLWRRAVRKLGRILAQA